MEEAKKSRLKIFLWDQLVRPIYLLLNLYQLQAILIALIIVNFVVWKSVWAFYIMAALLAVVFVYQIVKYYQSGEFIHNYRKYKSDRGEYTDFRKLAKTLKKEKLPRRTREEMNIEKRAIEAKNEQVNSNKEENEMKEDNGQDNGQEERTL